jgi:aryl-phospho-beta-D-glucosidase BglC (GH1 family)
MLASALTPNQAWAHQHNYQAGVNLGGWLVIEPWMFDQPPFASAGAEQDVVSSLRRVSDSHAISTMRNHWGEFVDDQTLNLLARFGITHLRIPVGYWILDAPVGSDNTTHATPAATMYDFGFQEEGFATGGMNYLEGLLDKLPSLGMRAVIDMHAMPGCSSKCQGYAGVSCAHPKSNRQLVAARLRPAPFRWLWLACGVVESDRFLLT